MKKYNSKSLSINLCHYILQKVKNKSRWKLVEFKNSQTQLKNYCFLQKKYNQSQKLHSEYAN